MINVPKPSLNLELQLIEDREKTLLQSIRAAVRHHVSTWRRIPALAWEAAHKDDLHTLTYLMACHYGLWPVSLDDNGWYANMWLDCTTGDLLDRDQPLLPADDEQLRGIYTKLYLVDPNQVVALLQYRIDHSHGESNDFLWMNGIRKNGGVANPFARIGPLPEKVSRTLAPSS